MASPAQLCSGRSVSCTATIGLLSPALPSPAWPFPFPSHLSVLCATESCAAVRRLTTHQDTTRCAATRHTIHHYIIVRRDATRRDATCHAATYCPADRCTAVSPRCRLSRCRPSRLHPTRCHLSTALTFYATPPGRRPSRCCPSSVSECANHGDNPSQNSLIRCGQCPQTSCKYLYAQF